jgi:hypothetical protein
MGIAYNTSIVRDGLILHLDAANVKSYPGANTTWYDISGNNNHATLVDSPTHSTENKGGLVLNGTSQYAEYSLANPYAETVIVWVKSGTTTWNKDGWLSSSRSSNGHIIHPDRAIKRVSFYIINSGGLGFTAIGSVTPDNITIPQMYAYTTNGSNSHKGYFNGDLVATITNNVSRTLTPTAQSTRVGRDSYTIDPSRFGNGTIYSTLRYNRELTAAEIRQNFEALRGRYGI